MKRMLMCPNQQSILFFIDHLGRGGAERITIDLAHILAQRGHLVTIAALNGQRNLLTTPSSVRLIDLELSNSFAFGKMWKKKYLSVAEQKRLADVLTQVKPNLIVTGYNNGHWLAPYLQGNVWHWIHGNLIENRKASNLWLKIKEFIRQIRHQCAFKQLFDQKKIITVNQDLKKIYADLVPNSTIQVITNGVDPKNLNYKKNYPHTIRKWDAIFLGRLVPIKQVDHALIAFARSGLQGRLLIAGDGTEKETLQKLAYELNIENRVDFFGWVENPKDVILQSKILILSSIEEGFGLVVAEALTLGTPVVAYNCSSGVRQQLCWAGGESGLVPPQDIELLSKKIFEVFHHPYHIDDDQLHNLTLDQTADQFEKLLDSP